MNLSQHPLHRLILVLTILLTLVSLVPASSAAARQGDPPLDLPAMALRTNDFVEEGKEGFGLGFSYLADRSRNAGEFIESSGWDAGNPDADIIAGAGAERTYLLSLDRLILDENDLAFFSQAAFTFVLEFDEDDEAGNALDEMEQQWLDAGHLDGVRRAERVGDTSFYLEGNGINPNSGNPVDRTTLVFQIETIVAGIVIINFTDDDPPTQELSESLALRQADRIEAVLDGDEGGSLSHLALRLRVDGNDGYMDSYLAFDGEWNCEDIHVIEPGQCDQRQAEADERQIEDYYYVRTRVAGDYLQGTPEAYVWVFLRSFSSDEAAEADFQRMVTVPSDGDVQTDLGIGDESFQVRDSTEASQRFTVIIRVDDMIVTIGHRTDSAMAAEQGWTLEPSESGTLELAETQVACMEGVQSCEKPVPVPKDMIPAELKDVSSVPGAAMIMALPDRRAS